MLQKTTNSLNNPTPSEQATYCKYFNIPDRVLSTSDENISIPVTDYTTPSNRFTPIQNLQQRRQKFEASFKQLLKVSPQQYSQLALQCTNNYEIFIEVLFHYQKAGHFQPYTFEMHKNSTRMKDNLLKMLRQQQQQSKLLLNRVKRLEGQCEQKNSIINNLQIKLANEIEQDQQLNDLLGKAKGKLKEREQQLDEMTVKFEVEIKKKDDEIEKLKDKNNEIKDNLNEIECQIKTLNLIDENSEKKPSAKSNPSPSPSPRLRNMNMKREKSCVKFPPHLSQAPGQAPKDRQFEETLERFLLIQAITIEQEIIERNQ